MLRRTGKGARPPRNPVRRLVARGLADVRAHPDGFAPGADVAGGALVRLRWVAAGGSRHHFA